MYKGGLILQSIVHEETPGGNCGGRDKEYMLTSKHTRKHGSGIFSAGTQKDSFVIGDHDAAERSACGSRGGISDLTCLTAVGAFGL